MGTIKIIDENIICTIKSLISKYVVPCIPNSCMHIVSSTSVNLLEHGNQIFISHSQMHYRSRVNPLYLALIRLNNMKASTIESRSVGDSCFLFPYTYFMSRPKLFPLQ